MYAVIRTGGKQYKVAPGDRIRVEKLDRSEAVLVPLMVVDGDTVTTDSGALAGMPVVVRVLEEGRGKKIVAGKYKPKSRYRRRWGHRQSFSLIEVESVAGVEAAPPEALVEEAEPEEAVEEEELIDDDAAAAAATASADVDDDEQDQEEELADVED